MRLAPVIDIRRNIPTNSGTGTTTENTNQQSREDRRKYKSSLKTALYVIDQINADGANDSLTRAGQSEGCRTF